jgi:hypothetical protein
MKNLHLHSKVNITKTHVGKLVVLFGLHVCGLICIFVKFIFINYIKKLHKNIYCHDQMQNEGHLLQAKH